MSTKKKNRKKERKLSSLILLLFLTVVLLATSTYAWFTANRTVTVDGIDVNVSASNGLLISSNAADGSWKTLIETSDLETGYSVSDGNGHTAASLNQLPSTMVPVSTINSVSNGLLTFYKGTLEDSVLTATSSAETSGSVGDFVSFDVFLKLDATANVYLTVGSGVTTSSSASTRGLHYATRMAIINEGTLSPSSSSQYDIVSQAGGSTAIFIEPNYDAHTTYGVQNAAYYQDYNYGTGRTYANLTAGTGSPVVSWDGVKTTISTGIPVSNTNATDNEDYFATVTPSIITTLAFSNADENETPKLVFTSLPAGVTKLHVYMWVEGQDIDCQNNASGSDLTFNLSFTLDAS